MTEPMHMQLPTIDPAQLERTTGGAWGLAVAGLAIGAAALGHQIWESGHNKGLQDREKKACPAV